MVTEMSELASGKESKALALVLPTCFGDIASSVLRSTWIMALTSFVDKHSEFFASQIEEPNTGDAESRDSVKNSDATMLQQGKQ